MAKIALYEHISFITMENHKKDNCLFWQFCASLFEPSYAMKEIGTVSYWLIHAAMGFVSTFFLSDYIKT